MPESENGGKFSQVLLNMLTLGPRTCASERRFAVWVLLWAVSLLITKMLIRYELVSGSVAWIFPVVTVLFSLVAFYMYYQFLMLADELARKIQIEGISLGFGIGVLVMMAQEAFDLVGAPQLDSNDLLLVMVLGWVFGQLWGHWKYQ